MSVDRKLAAKAFALSEKGLKGKAIGVEIGVSTDEADRLAAQGRQFADLKKLPLTAREMLLLHTLNAGETRSPESKTVSWRARKSESSCRYSPETNFR